MKFVILALTGLFATANVFAAPIDCKTFNPCAWAGSSSLGFCAPNKFTVNSENGSVSKIKLSELYRVDGEIRAKVYKTVSLTMSEGMMNYVAQDARGDIKLDIAQANGHFDYANLTGELSFGDYGFKVKCLRADAIGWE